MKSYSIQDRGLAIIIKLLKPMLMNDLLKTELFGLLTKNSKEVSNEEIKNAYENFVVQVQHLNQSENDYSVIFRL